EPGRVCIKRGVPCRNNVWKHAVIDGINYTPTRGIQSDQKIYRAGESPRMTCSSYIDFDRPLVGESGDSFVVSLRMRVWASANPDKSADSYGIHRSGYYDLSTARWRARNTKACLHVRREGDAVTLDPGCVALSHVDGSVGHVHAKVFILLTARNTPARWRALVNYTALTTENYDPLHIMLRGDDCCFRCAVDQVITLPGSWYLIL
ncbi:hypothetical protein K469DRAFT_563022, partial [Zopfia rhizophila CBS 207.26]